MDIITHLISVFSVFMETLAIAMLALLNAKHYPDPLLSQIKVRSRPLNAHNEVLILTKRSSKLLHRIHYSRLWRIHHCFFSSCPCPYTVPFHWSSIIYTKTTSINSAFWYVDFQQAHAWPWSCLAFRAWYSMYRSVRL